MINDIHDLELLLHSHIPLITIETSDERQVTELFGRLGLNLGQPVMSWSAATGLQRIDLDLPPQRHASEPQQALGQIRATDGKTIYLLMDFHPYLDDPVTVRMLKEIALDYPELGHTLVFVSHALQLPAELAGFSARFDLSLPDAGQLEQLVREEAGNWSAANNGRQVQTDRRTLDLVTRQLGGLTTADARRIIHQIIRDDGAISADDLERITRARYRLLEGNSAISIEFDTDDFAAVGGLANLKDWIGRRRSVFLDSVPGPDMPRGILLVGVQGGGKSLAARAIAGLWQLPLLRLDFGTLFNKFFGETERNLRESLSAAEAMAPCVLWIDEIEKAIATGDQDNGTSKRMLGHLLTWMAERTSPVFIVATANVIEQLPPELIRKGRLDEIFFVDLPDAATRAEIFAIHLRKRDYQPIEFDLLALAGITEGFSGSEIEQAIVSATYLAREQQVELNTGHIEDEVRQTRPLSQVMAERIVRLRQWASERTVPAN